MVFGYLLARIVISTLFLPHYFRGEMFTAYELMQRRFGPRIRKLTAGTFLVVRALAEGVRVFAISIVISIILGTGEMASIVLIVCLTLFYTFEGGMTAVIWTDVVQMFLYVFGAIVSLFVILNHIPGGWAHVVDVAAPLGKFQVFDFGFEFTPEFFSRTYTFWAGVVGGCFLTTASHGTEQLMVQRLLAARTQSESRAALFASWFVILFQFALFLVIGVILLRLLPGHRDCPPRSRRTGFTRSSSGSSLPAGPGRPGDRRDSGRRDVEPERGTELAGLHHRHGLSTSPLEARARARAPRRPTCRWPAAPRSAGACVLLAIGVRGAPLGPVSRGRPHDRVDRLRRVARRFPARAADEARRGTSRHLRHGRGSRAHGVREISHADRLDLVCCDRDADHVRAGLG